MRANAALVALLSWQLAGPATRGARAAALAAGLAFAWFAPSAEAVAWVAARFDGMALLWMLVAACAFMASRAWWDRYGLASLAATVLAFMSKESAAIGPALIVALAWARRSERGRASSAGSCARSLDAWPWIAIGAAYFAYRTWIFGDPFRFYPGTSPGSDAPVSGKWLAALPASADWWPRVMPEAGTLRVYALAGLFIGIAAVSAGLTDPREGRVLAAVRRRVRRRDARCCSRIGAGRRTAKADASCTRWRRSPRWRWRCRCARPMAGCARAAWVIALVLLGSGLDADPRHGRTPRAGGRRGQRADRGARGDGRRDARELVRRSSSFPTASAPIPFARNAQGGLMLPPVQRQSLSPDSSCSSPTSFPDWPQTAGEQHHRPGSSPSRSRT